MPSLIPMVVEQTGQGERSMDIFSRLGRERIIMVDTDFNPQMASVISAQLMVMDSESQKKPIQLHINSPGGEVYSLLQILSTIDMIKAPVHTFNTGLAASCGSALFNYGAPGHRYVTKWGTQMVHQPSSGTRGTITDQDISLSEGKRLKSVLLDLYIERNTADLSRAKISSLMERDKWLSPQEAIDLGFADGFAS